eukprot:7614635-Karenia_brevis.AAC.1
MGPAKAASTPINKFTDLARLNIPTPKSKGKDLDQAGKNLKDSHCYVSFDMIDYCQDALRLYRDCTGIRDFRRADTPFCLDGSLPAAGEEVQGMLSGDSCRLLMKAFR